VHLTRETYAGDIFGTQACALDRFGNRDATSSPPVFRMLLRPTDLWRCERLMLFRRRGYDMAVLIDDQRPRAARSNVDAECIDGDLLACNTCAPFVRAP